MVIIIRMGEKDSSVALHLSGFQTQLMKDSPEVLLTRNLAHSLRDSGSGGLEWCSGIGIYMKFIRIRKSPTYLSAVEDKL